MSRNSTEPLLRDDRRGLSEANDDHIHRHITWLAPSGDDSYLHTTRSRIQRFLTSKTGHYCILLLVSLDVACIFADFVIKIFICEQKDAAKGWNEALDALGIVSLVFSCLFMVELLASIWASGLS